MVAFGPRADNRRVAPAHRAARQIRVLDRGLHFVLEAAGPGGLHAGDVRVTRNGGALIEHRQLVGGLHLPHVRQQAHGVADAHAEEPFAGLVGEVVRRD